MAANPESREVPPQISLFADTALSPVETFRLDEAGGVVARRVARRDGTISETTLPLRDDNHPDPAAAFDASWLRSPVVPPVEPGTELRFVDLFSGCGAMSLGVWEASRALGLVPVPLLAVDVNRRALGVYTANMPSARASSEPVETVLDGDPGDAITPRETGFLKELGRVDLAVGGPPCQGHSDLNNHTRRNDPKNRLYLRMARFAEIARPQHLIIENVPGALHDRSGVVHETVDHLKQLGYHVQTGVLDAHLVGVAQRRRRFFTVASLVHPIDFGAIGSRYGRPERPLAWAIGDLVDSPAEGVFDTPSQPSTQNQARIDYLFENGLYDLPDEQRPDCHRLKPHTYKSVYGRLPWELPAPTITTGFGSTGQGRNVHPSQPRTLTPHEAARIQFIPDFFDFGETGRTALQMMIGNAVPPKIAYLLALELLR